MENKIFLIFFIFIFLFGVSFVLAETPEDEKEVIVYEGEPVNILSIVGPDSDLEELIVDEVTLNLSGGLSTLTINPIPYSKPTGRIKIGKNDFTEITSREGYESYIKVNSKGEIIEARLTSGTRASQEIYFGEKSVFSLPPGGTLIYRDGKKEIILPDETSSRSLAIRNWNKEDGEIEIKRQNGKAFDFFYGENDENKISFEHGPLIRYDGENLYVKEGDFLNYNGLEFTPETKVNFYSDGKLHEGENSISLGKSTFALSRGEKESPGKIFITEESSYYFEKIKESGSKDLLIRSSDGSLNTAYKETVEERKLDSFNYEIYKKNKNPETGNYYSLEDFENIRNQYRREMTLELTNENSALTFGIEKSLVDPGIPAIKLTNGGKIETGSRGIIFGGNGREGVTRTGNPYGKSLEMVIIDETHEKYLKEVQIGHKSNILISIADKEVGWVGYDLRSEIGRRKAIIVSNDLEAETVGYHYRGNENLQEEHQAMRGELLEHTNALHDGLRRKYPNDDLSLFFDEKSLSKAIEGPNTLDYFLDDGEMLKILGPEDYENFFSLYDSFTDGTIIPDVYGKEEEGFSFDEMVHGASSSDKRFFYGKRAYQSIRAAEEQSELLTRASRFILDADSPYYDSRFRPGGGGYSTIVE